VYLARTPVFAPHPRIAAAARALGLGTVVETAPADEGIVAGLETFFARVSAS
jgi:uroporphyrinogen-III synthase